MFQSQVVCYLFDSICMGLGLSKHDESRLKQRVDKLDMLDRGPKSGVFYEIPFIYLQ